MQSLPNAIVAQGDNFYISYNDQVSIYGSDTTAIVTGQMQAFYILNGDHRQAYRSLVQDGLAACLAYFQANIGAANRHSDRLPQ